MRERSHAKCLRKRVLQDINDSSNGSPWGQIMSAYIVLRGHAPSFSMPHGITNAFHSPSASKYTYIITFKEFKKVYLSSPPMLQLLSSTVKVAQQGRWILDHNSRDVSSEW
jgi:hypothetical protein